MKRSYQYGSLVQLVSGFDLGWGKGGEAGFFAALAALAAPAMGA